jgi:hypothetical protein
MFSRVCVRACVCVCVCVRVSHLGAKDELVTTANAGASLLVETLRLHLTHDDLAGLVSLCEWWEECGGEQMLVVVVVVMPMLGW